MFICLDCKGIIDNIKNQCTCKNQKNIENNSLIEIKLPVREVKKNDGYNNLFKDIEKSINSNCLENNSNTPDFILAEFLQNTFKLAEEFIKNRDKWYSINPHPGWRNQECGCNNSKIINNLEDMKKIQSNSLVNDYMTGYYNGIELALSMLKNKEPKFIDIPEGAEGDKDDSKHNE